MPGQFEGKIVKILEYTGASALLFGRDGVKVVVMTGVNFEGGEETIEKIKKDNGEALSIGTDVSKLTEVLKLTRPFTNPRETP